MSMFMHTSKFTFSVTHLCVVDSWDLPPRCKVMMSLARWRTTLTTGVSMLMTRELRGCEALDWHFNIHYCDIISQSFLSEMSAAAAHSPVCYWWFRPLDPETAEMSAAVNSLRGMMVKCGVKVGDEGREAVTTQISSPGEWCCSRFFPQMSRLQIKLQYIWYIYISFHLLHVIHCNSMRWHI